MDRDETVESTMMEEDSLSRQNRRQGLTSDAHRLAHNYTHAHDVPLKERMEMCTLISHQKKETERGRLVRHQLSITLKKRTCSILNACKDSRKNPAHPVKPGPRARCKS